MKKIIAYESRAIKGDTTIPGDKSISHRALMFAPLAVGQSRFRNLLLGHDCLATLNIMRCLGAHIGLSGEEWFVNGEGGNSLSEPLGVLDCQNSGTTIRLLTGLLSGLNMMAVLDGSEQIKRRPMDRIVKPLSMMNAMVFGRHANSLAPLVVTPSKLKGIEYELPVKSAQVKSALILAALFADGPTVIKNTKATRDHTELLLSYMGASIKNGTDQVLVEPLNTPLKPFDMDIPGDISSAAFLLVLGAVSSKEGVVLKNVGINPTRTGILDAMLAMGADITLVNEHTVANEPVADIIIKKSTLQGCIFEKDHIVRMIDEIPILALLATQAHGETVIKDAEELKVKESNRISKTVEALRDIGAHIEETSDGMIIKGPTELKGGQINSHHDHRLALMGVIAGLIGQGHVAVLDASVTDDSFPGFVEILKNLGAKIDEAL